MRVEQRRMARCFKTRAEIQDHQLRLKLNGVNSKDKSVEFVADMPFYFIPYLITELQKAWTDEREYRTAEISRIDAALPK